MSETPHNLELRGHIVTVEPFANSPADCKPKSGPDKDLQKLPRIGGKPFIAASAIRGVLRRAAALEAVELFPSGQVKYADWLLFAVGGVKGSGDEKCDPSVRHEYIENNPLVALFGAGDAAGPGGKIGGMIGSKLHIAHAVADRDDIVLEKGDGVVGGARAHENTSLVLHEVVDDLDSAAEFTRMNSDRAALEQDIKRLSQQTRSKGKGADNEKIPAAERKKLEAELGGKKAELKELKDRMLEKFGTDESIGRPLIGYEAIPAGQRIRHRMTLAAVNSAQLGMFFSALERFALNPVVGAHRGHRCGRIRCEYDVYEHRRDNNGVRLVRLGRLVFGEPEMGDSEKGPDEIPVFQVEGDGLTKLRNGCANWRKECKPENLRPFPRDGSKKPDASEESAQ